MTAAWAVETGVIAPSMNARARAAARRKVDFFMIFQVLSWEVLYYCQMSGTDIVSSVNLYYTKSGNKLQELNYEDL